MRNQRNIQLLPYLSNNLQKMELKLTTGLLAVIILFFIRCAEANLPHITDSELRNLSENLFNDENPNFKNWIKINLQGQLNKSNYQDVSLQPLFIVNSTVMELPIVKNIIKLFDNYEPDTSKEEFVTQNEYEEEENLIESLLDTKPVNRVMRFLSDRGFFLAENQTYKETFRNIWFTQYARTKKSNVIGSSGFEHVFLGELKSNKKLTGLHNWIIFNIAERAGTLNYWGYRKTKFLENNGPRILAYVVFRYLGKLKSSSIFIGISPELEISLYTLCYIVRPNSSCQLSIKGQKFKIKTYVLDHGNSIKPSLGTAFGNIFS